MNYVTRYRQTSQNKEWIGYDQAGFLLLAARLIYEKQWSPEFAAGVMQNVALSARYHSRNGHCPIIFRAAKVASIDSVEDANICVFSKTTLRKRLKSGALTQLSEVSLASVDPLS